jgi:hypothetical protein
VFADILKLVESLQKDRNRVDDVCQTSIEKLILIKTHPAYTDSLVFLHTPYRKVLLELYGDVMLLTEFLDPAPFFSDDKADTALRKDNFRLGKRKIVSYYNQFRLMQF